MGRQRGLRAGKCHGVMMLLQRGKSSRRLGITELILFLLSSLGGGHDLASPRLVGRMVEEGPNVVDEERVEQFSNLLLVGKIQGSLKGDPESMVSKQSNQTRQFSEGWQVPF